MRKWLNVLRWQQPCIQLVQSLEPIFQRRKKHRQIVKRVVARVGNQALALSVSKWRSFLMEDARMRVERLILKMSNGLKYHEVPSRFYFWLLDINRGPTAAHYFCMMT